LGIAWDPVFSQSALVLVAKWGTLLGHLFAKRTKNDRVSYWKVKNTARKETPQIATHLPLEFASQARRTKDVLVELGDSCVQQSRNTPISVGQQSLSSPSQAGYAEHEASSAAANTKDGASVGTSDGDLDGGSVVDVAPTGGLSVGTGDGASDTVGALDGVGEPLGLDFGAVGLREMVGAAVLSTGAGDAASMGAGSLGAGATKGGNVDGTGASVVSGNVPVGCDVPFTGAGLFGTGAR
jgi:hypothetical protein